VLSSSSVVALGFGDLAQLEYRNSAAITRLEDAPISLPSLGVQLKFPFKERTYVPAFAVAIRFGFPRSETTGDGQIHHDERVADLYFVGRLRLWGPLDRFTLHGGLRVGAAEIKSTGAANLEETKRNLVLPAGGWEVQMTPNAVLAGELALVPLFEPGDTTRPNRIGSGIFGRAGVRWRVMPALVIDASVGYRIEVDQLSPSSSTSAAGLVDWDMRLGAELFLPWGAALCRRTGVFCE